MDIFSMLINDVSIVDNVSHPFSEDYLGVCLYTSRYLRNTAG